MDKKIIKARILLLLLIFFPAINLFAASGTLTKPVFWSDIVDIPKDGVVIEISGNIQLLKENGYMPLVVGQTIRENDVLEIYPNAQVTIDFGNKQIVKSKQFNETKHIVFKYLK